MTLVEVVRSPLTLLPDPKRCLVRTYLPPDPAPGQPNRIQRVLQRVLDLTPEERSKTLEDVHVRFGDRVADLEKILLDGFSVVDRWVAGAGEMPLDDRQLIGSYFTHEYAVEGAALTNPSIVPHPNQDGLPAGVVRVVVSLRAVGEGHMSSVEFRTGRIDVSGAIQVEKPGPLIRGRRETPVFDKAAFGGKLAELGFDAGLQEFALGSLDEQFTMEDLESVLTSLESDASSVPIPHQIIHTMHWLASSNYRVTFAADSEISQRILTPNGPAESHGMEDARFVRFDDDGASTYYGTYTAFDGVNILPQLIETKDFRNFRVATLHGTGAVNKGIAMFPRRVEGRYMALGRSDGESNYLMWSQHVQQWNDSKRIQMPARPWEIIQLGNAGAPIETEAGWLVTTHGVGPMRQYALGAVLLDIDEPDQMIGHLRDPLLIPNEDERDGYVPNVAYSCGSILHEGNLVIAYGASDTSTRFATLSLDSLLSALSPS